MHTLWLHAMEEVSNQTSAHKMYRTSGICWGNYYWLGSSRSLMHVWMCRKLNIFRLLTEATDLTQHLRHTVHFDDG